VHRLRGRVDAILIGRGTRRPMILCSPLAPPGPRTGTRIVLDSRGPPRQNSQLVRTARETPLLIAASPEAAVDDRAAARRRRLRDPHLRRRQSPRALGQLLDELGRRQVTNILVEGGGELLGELFDARLIDEVHVFIAPKLCGGQSAPEPGSAGVG